MSREFLFRGKTPSDYENGIWGEWVEGFYTRFNGEEHRIYSGYAETECGDYYPDYCNVLPETVGQYTGLTDNNRKNKKKIFEGDIVKAYFNFNPTDFVVGKVIFEYGTFKIRVTGTKKKGEFSKFTDDNIKAYAIENNFINRGYLLEVIGNVHDNPELLK